jgi:hypothetical protein
MVFEVIIGCGQFLCFFSHQNEPNFDFIGMANPLPTNGEIFHI